MSLFHPNGPEAVNKGHTSELIALISSCALALAAPLHSALPCVHGDARLDHVLRLLCGRIGANRIVKENVNLSLIAE